MKSPILATRRLRKALRSALAVMSFLAAYTAEYEAQNWIGVYWLDWWDPKFGSKEGTIAFGNEILPFFLSAAMVSWTIGTIFVTRSMLAASTARVVYGNAMAGILAAAVPFCLSVAARDQPALEFPARLAVLAITLAGPGLFVAVIFRRSSAAVR
jgi:hypothetical protein